MTAKQLAFWNKSLWPQYCKILRARGFSAADLRQERDALYVRALGERKSSKEWTTDEFSKVIKEVEKVTKPDDLNAAMETPEQRQRRILTTSIFQLGFPPEYMEKILLSRWKVDDCDLLTVEQLKTFQIHLIQQARRNAKKKKAANA